MRFLINIFDGTGEFELCESGSAAVSGRIKEPEDVDKEHLLLPPIQSPQENYLPLSTADVYKDLRLRGYDYNGVFRGVKQADNRGNYVLFKCSK